MRKEIEERMGIKAHEAYGLTELRGPGVAFDCEAQDGYLHVNEDHILIEIIDPVTGEVPAPGTKRRIGFYRHPTPGHALAALSHPGYHLYQTGKMRLRPHFGQDGKGLRAQQTIC